MIRTFSFPAIDRVVHGVGAMAKVPAMVDELGGRRGVIVPGRPSHAATIACLVAAGLGLHVGVLYWIGVAAVAALLAYEHALVKPDDLRRLDAAFFTMNGVISVAFAAFVIADAVS